MADPLDRPSLDRPSRLYTAEEVAEYLKCSLSHVYEEASLGRFPVIRIGRRAIRFDLDAVLAASRAGASA
jgi:excisionase family DNA binding protein